MKKISALLIMSLLIFRTTQSIAFAAEPFLITDTQLTLSPATTPNRAVVSFNLSEAIDLSQEKSNIIIDFLGKDLETTNYVKNKTWSGYLNSYDNYPSGEHKYSSGYLNEDYLDLVPATKIYTVTKTGNNIDIAAVGAVKITVLRADGSGEETTVGIDGDIIRSEEIEAPKVDNPSFETLPPSVEQNLGIKIDSETAALPPNTILIAEELSGGSFYNDVSLLMSDARNFVVFDIKLESDGQSVQPDGKVKISIPIPETFNSANLAVYRIDDNGKRVPYSVTITKSEGIKYATFLADHFSAYVLVEKKAQVKQETNENVETKKRTAAADDNIKMGSEKNTTEKKAAETPEKKAVKVKSGNKIPATGQPKTQNYMAAIVLIILSLFVLNIKRISKKS